MILKTVKIVFFLGTVLCTFFINHEIQGSSYKK